MRAAAIILIVSLCLFNPVVTGVIQKSQQGTVRVPTETSGGGTTQPRHGPAKPESGQSESGPKTAEAGSTPKTPLEKFAGQLGAVRSVIIDVLLIILLFAFLVAAFWELTRESVVIEPIDVPEDLAKKGYGPDVVARRIAGAIRVLMRKARSTGQLEDGLEMSAAQLAFTVPTAGISYRGVIRYTRQILGRPEERVRGEIVRDGDMIRMLLRTRTGMQTSSRLCVSEEQLPILLERAAFEVATLVDPGLVATYWFWAEQKERIFDKTMEAILRCLAQAPANQHDVAYTVWGNVLTLQRSFDEAEAKYRTAIELVPRSAQAYNSWGNLLRAKRRFDEAAAMYKKSISLDRGQASAWGNLGSVCNDRRMYEQAATNYRRALHIDARYVQAWNGLGYSLWRLGNYGDALAKLERATNLDPAFGWSYINWGRLLFTQHQYEEAFGKYKIAAEQTSVATAAYADWGDRLVRLGRYKEAEEIYGRAQAADPDSGNGLSGLGFSLRRRRRYEEAIGFYQKALAVNPFHTGAMFGWAESLRSLHRFDEAIRKYEEMKIALRWYSRTLRTVPEGAGILADWGDAIREDVGRDKTLAEEERNRRYEHAEQKLRHAIEMDPWDTTPLRTLGNLFVERERPREALSYFEKTIRVDQEDWWAWMRKGDVLLKLKRARRAVEAYRRAELLQPDNLRVVQKLGETLQKLGRHKEAVRKLELALQIAPKNARIRCLLADSLGELGQLQSAIEQYETAALEGTDSTKADALAGLGLALVKMGENDAASERFREALSIQPKHARANEGLNSMSKTGRRVGHP